MPISDEESPTDLDSDYSVENEVPLELDCFHPTFSEWSVEPEREGEATIHRLPEDVLLQLMLLLEPIEQLQCGMVCRRWYNLSRAALSTLPHMEVYTMFSVFRLKRAFTAPQLVQMLLLTRASLQHGNLSYADISPEVCRGLGYCNRLTILNFSRVKFSKRLATAFSANAPPSLETLILDSCESLNEKCLKKMLMNVPKLLNLEVAFNSSITGKSIVNCLRRNPLKHLRVQFCRRFGTRTFCHILQTFRESLEQLEISSYAFSRMVGDKPLPNLSQLRRFTCRREVEWVTRSDVNFVRGFLAASPNLEYLNIGEIQTTMDFYIPWIVEHCPNLEYLDISNAQTRNESPQMKQISKLRKLRTLKADGKAADAKFDWLTGCSSLTTLSLQSSQIRDREVFAIVSSLEKLKSMNIQDCYLVSGSFVDECKDLTRTAPPLTIHCPPTVSSVQEDLPPFLTIRVRDLLSADEDDDDPYDDPYDDFDDFDDYADFVYGDYFDGGFVDDRFEHQFDHMILDDMDAIEDGDNAPEWNPELHEDELW